MTAIHMLATVGQVLLGRMRIEGERPMQLPMSQPASGTGRASHLRLEANGTCWQAVAIVNYPRPALYPTLKALGRNVG